MENPTSTVNLEDFTCSICREIFHSPVSLSCPHTYCHTCVLGLKKSSMTNETMTAITSLRPDSTTHSLHLHQSNQCFVCAICRQESLGYVRYRALDEQLRRLTSECSVCANVFTLAQLRIHSENCFPRQHRSTTNPIPNQHLSESQIRALEKAQQGENRSTFSCPFCTRTNFTVQHLRQHMKKRHRNENPARVCPICASMPWGDKTLVVSNVYQHIKSRHRFEYDTFVNFDQDEDAMMREALKASLFDQ